MNSMGWLLTALLTAGCLFAWWMNDYQMKNTERNGQNALVENQRDFDSISQDAQKEVERLQKAVADLERQRDELDPTFVEQQLTVAKAKTADLTRAVEVRSQNLLLVDRYWREIQQMKK